MDIDWHAGRTSLDNLCLLDRDPADAEIDQAAVRGYRQDRVREQMAQLGVDACLLFDPVNIRYASGARNMQVFNQRNPARYLFLPLTGPVILFEFTGCEHLANGLETIDEVRPAITASFVAAGPGITERERIWAREIGSLVREQCHPGATVGIERVNAGAALSLAAEGFHIVDAQHPVELARAIKSDEELKCIRSSVRATERAVEVLRSCLVPGLTEQQLWSFLHQGVIAQGGDYVETRLLTSGERTNPWFQESSEHLIGSNELVALDTDVVGCFGYYTDFSRTFHSGPDKPSEQQKTLYKVSLEQINHNIGIVRPGMTFKEYSEKAWDIPEPYLANRYYLSAHGCGMTGEYPYLYHRMDYRHAGYDGVLEPNMTICIESYIGEEGGREGVKLEQHCLITESGLEVLSQYPFEAALMDDSIHTAPDLRLVRDGASAPADQSSEPAATQPGDTPTAPTRDAASAAAPGTRPRRAVVAEAESDEQSPQPPAWVDRLDLALLHVAEAIEDVTARCLRAAAEGICSIAVAPRHLAAVRGSLCSHEVRLGTTVGLPDSGATTAAKALEVREAIRSGARAVDIVIDVEAVQTGDHTAALADLCRVIDPAREARVRTAVILECGRLNDAQQVAAARIAARVRPDIIATGSGIDGDAATPRQIALIREAAGHRRAIRALLHASGADAQSLLAAGADRLGIAAGRPDSRTGSAS